MIMTNNPYRDWENYCEEQEEAYRRLPKCDYCKERITDDMCWLIEGELLCDNCAKVQYAHWTDEWIEEDER